MTSTLLTDQTTGTAVEILEKLVSFDTTSHKSNIPCIDWIEAYLADHDVAATRITTPDGEKANLFATIGPADMPGIGLSGHTDVVPVTGQDWDTDPFKLTPHGTRLYGRGSCDMKGFLACMLTKLPEFTSAPLKTPIHFMFSYDEEVGCTGVRPMIAELGKTLPKPRYTIVGEPTSMQVVDAHKGASRFDVTVYGKEAHSSMPHIGVNAINVCARLILELERLQAQIVAERPQDERFTPPYSTVHVGTIQGGEAENIVPRLAQFTFEVRNIPGLDVQEIKTALETFAHKECLPAMHAVDAATDIKIVQGNEIPPFQTSDATGIVPLTLGLAQQNDLHAVPYGTEAGLFERGGSVSIICGPGDIAQAHAPNEFIEVGDLTKCLDFMDRLTDWCATN